VSGQPDDSVLILMPGGGGLLISREVFDDAVEMGAPVRAYLAGRVDQVMEPPPTDNDWLKTEPIQGSGR